MYLLNYIYFLIITILGVKFLFMKQDIIVHPLNKKKKIVVDGPELFWILTFATGLLAFSAPGILDLMAIRLLILEIFLMVGVFIVKRRPQWNAVSISYLVYIIWLIIGLSYSPAPIYGLRTILKYLYPFLIMLFASAAVRHKEVFIKAGLGARVIAIISIGVYFIPMVSLLMPGVFWSGTASAIHYIPMCTFSLALFYHGGKDKKDILLTILFMLPCILWVFRTSIMGTALALMAFFFFKYRLKALPVIFGILLLFIISIFTIPSVKEKMFKYKKENATVQDLRSGEISFDDINSNGRFAMWEWSFKRYFHHKELVGSGTGNLQYVFYTEKHPFLPMRICHNDYVQILCDGGLISLILFGGSFLLLIFHSFRTYQNKKYSIAIRICAITAGASATGMLLTLYTDNVVNYTMATLSYPCGFYGMMLGLIEGYKKEKINAI